MFAPCKVTAAVLAGAHIIRVHAVDEMVQVIRVAETIRQAGLADSGQSDTIEGRASLRHGTLLVTIGHDHGGFAGGE